MADGWVAILPIRSWWDRPLRLKNSTVADRNRMEATFPTVEAILEIESRQDEVLRKLDELEKRLMQTLAQFGDQRLLQIAGSTAAVEQPPSTSAKAA